MLGEKSAMPNSSLLCVDASIVVRLVTVASDNPVQHAWRRWRRDGHRFVAPRLLRYEVTNALHQARRAGRLDDVTVLAALRIAVGQPIEYHDDELLHEAALAFARRFNRPASYDSHYLALAEKLGAEFWTLDQRLYNAVNHQLTWIHLIGESD
jgi:predicted nucleic acid-binding protein